MVTEYTASTFRVIPPKRGTHRKVHTLNNWKTVMKILTAVRTLDLTKILRQDSQAPDRDYSGLRIRNRSSTSQSLLPVNVTCCHTLSFLSLTFTVIYIKIASTIITLHVVRVTVLPSCITMKYILVTYA